MSGRKLDVTALGELLIDMTAYGISKQGNNLLEVNPGGAPCNVLSMVSKLGGKTAFIGKVGDDKFGEFLEETIEAQGIDTKGLVRDKRYATTLAFVHLATDGERSFSFSRKPGADMMLKQDEIDEELIKCSKIFHFGTLSMTNEPALSATKYAIDIAEKSDCLITFDPNIRLLLWDSRDDAISQMRYGFSKCHILKLSAEEIQLATDTQDLTEAVEIIADEFPNIQLILVTLGNEGSFSYYKGAFNYVPPFLLDNTIDTTGAGDAFMGCCLYEIAKHGISNLDEEKLNNILCFANAAAALITTKNGAMKEMPDKKTVEDLINNSKISK